MSRKYAKPGEWFYELETVARESSATETLRQENTELKELVRSAREIMSRWLDDKCWRFDGGHDVVDETGGWLQSAEKVIDD